MVDEDEWKGKTIRIKLFSVRIRLESCYFLVVYVSFIPTAEFSEIQDSFSHFLPS